MDYMNIYILFIVIGLYMDHVYISICPTPLEPIFLQSLYIYTDIAHGLCIIDYICIDEESRRTQYFGIFWDLHGSITVLCYVASTRNPHIWNIYVYTHTQVLPCLLTPWDVASNITGDGWCFLESTSYPWCLISKSGQHGLQKCTNHTSVHLKGS